MRALGLRSRVILAFTVGSLLVAVTFAVLTYVLTNGYLLSQRERSVLRQVYADADFVRGRFETRGTDATSVLTAVAPSQETTIIVRWGDDWYSTSLETTQDDLPASLKAEVGAGRPARIRTPLGDDPVLMVGVPLPSVNASFYEIRSLRELEDTLDAFALVLGVSALLAAGAGAGVGVWASRTVLQPLNGVASTAAQIAAGQLDARLETTRDPDLATIVGSFNSMVDSLAQRIERDARLAADVSHELRSPLTTLIASVEVMNSRKDELPERTREALALVTAELERFHQLLDTLLELARADAGLDPDRSEVVPLHELLSHVLSDSERAAEILDGDRDVRVLGDKIRLERVFSNLLDNADQHGGGVVAVTVTASGERAVVLIDDAGPGVPPHDRERIFERFATGRTARGSGGGTGLGLALVSETIAAHGGAVWCAERAGGGARFVVSLPLFRTPPSAARDVPVASTESTERHAEEAE